MLKFTTYEILRTNLTITLLNIPQYIYKGTMAQDATHIHIQT